MISALGWAQHAGVEISVDEFNTDYEFSLLYRAF
jgi:hypothetical protein